MSFFDGRMTDIKTVLIEKKVKVIILKDRDRHQVLDGWYFKSSNDCDNDW